MKQPLNPEQVVNRLAKRRAKASESGPDCMLGREPSRRRGGSCSACTALEEFEIDRAVAQLINSLTFKRAGVCPYLVVASHLVAGFTVGPEAFRARSVGQYRVDPVMELKGALRHIRTVLRATGLSREDIEVIDNDGDRWKAFRAVLTAERASENALEFFGRQSDVKARRPPRGRTGALHIQAVARAMALAWRRLTARLPAKDNSKFHGLLLAAVATIFGHPAKEPDWESATKTAVERIKKDEASRG